jgi:integrase
VIPLSQPTVALLQEWFKVVKRKAAEDFIFSTTTGKPKEPRQITRDYIVPACGDLGLPRAGWLTFRRTFATWADENGASAKQRGELIGNSAEINAHVYTQTTDEGLRRAVEEVGAALTSTKNSEQLFTN